MRYAIFFTPPHRSALLETAQHWLGRNAFTGQDVPVSPIGSLSAEAVRDLSSFPRTYGFHATLKAPFRPCADGLEETLRHTIEDLARKTKPINVGSITIRRLGSHFALMPALDSDPLSEFAAQCVRTFEPFRAPLTSMEIEKRRPEKLSAVQRDYLFNWGYPYVFDAFRFHMTLTRAVSNEEQHDVDVALQSHFARVMHAPLMIDGIGLFCQPDQNDNFVVKHYAPLTG